jgi:hypothetical protein
MPACTSAWHRLHRSLGDQRIDLGWRKLSITLPAGGSLAFVSSLLYG